MRALWRRFQLWRHRDYVQAAATFGLTPHPDAKRESWPEFERRVDHWLESR